jgi:hypothetical protein
LESPIINTLWLLRENSSMNQKYLKGHDFAVLMYCEIEIGNNCISKHHATTLV